MLGKLTKFEFKATARIFIPLYLAVCGALLFSKGFEFIYSLFWDYTFSEAFEAVWDFVYGFMFAVYVVSIILAIFLTLFIVLQRFYKNLFGDEGYLMHTLPVSAKSHILSKLIVAGVWTLASVIVIWVAISLYVNGMDFFKDCVDFFTEMPERAAEHKAKLGGNYYLFNIFAIINVLLLIPLVILGFYFSIALGGRILPKHRIGGSFIGFVAVSVMVQVYISILIAIVNSSWGTSAIEFIEKSEILPFLLLLSFQLIPGLIFFFATSHILSKKLNLE